MIKLVQNINIMAMALIFLWSTFIIIRQNVNIATDYLSSSSLMYSIYVPLFRPFH